MKKFDQSDKTLSAAKIGLIMKVVSIALMLGFFALMLWVNVFQSLPNARYISNYGWQWVFSIALTAVSVLVPIATWKLGLMKIWSAYDLKVMRNKQCGAQDGAELNMFGEGVAPAAPYAAPARPVYTAPVTQAAPASDMVVCASCGATVRKSTFCGKCGSPM